MGAGQIGHGIQQSLCHTHERYGKRCTGSFAKPHAEIEQRLGAEPFQKRCVARVR
jgi:hypothetical protein